MSLARLCVSNAISACVKGILPIMPLLFVVPNISLADGIPVDVSAIEKYQARLETTLYCSVESINPVKIVSESNAILETVAAVASIVEKGELVAGQKNFYLLKEVETLAEEIAIADTGIAYREKELTRINQLYKANSTSESAKDKLEFEMRDLLSQRKMLSIEKSVLEHKLEKLQHFAGAKSQVADIHAHVGESVQEGQPIATLLPLDSKRLRCDAPFSKLNQVNDDKTVFQYGGQEVPLESVSNAVIEQTNIANLFFRLDGELSRKLFFKQRLAVSMRVKRDRLYKIPVDALRFSQDSKPFIWVVNGEEKAERKQIELAETYRSYQLVQSPLSNYRYVVIRGSERLREGSRVRFVSIDKL